MYSGIKKYLIAPLVAVMMTAGLLPAASQPVFAQETASEEPGLVILGDGVNGSEGFQKNVIYITSEQNEKLREDRNPQDYGLGDSWVSNARYSSYDNHGTGGFHYTIADGLDVYALTDAVTGGKADETGSIDVISYDTYHTILNFEDMSTMKYFSPADYTGTQSARPMIAYYKTTAETDTKDEGTEPEGSAEALAAGSLTYVYGQTSVKDDNNCHFVKGINSVVIPATFNSYLRSSNTGYAPAKLRDVICEGTAIREYEVADENGGSDVQSVKGMILSDALDRLSITKYMPDYADILIQAESSDRKTLSITRSQIEDSVIAWDYADDTATPAEQTGYMAFYTKDASGNTSVLYNLSKINITDKDGNVLTSVPQQPLSPPDAVKSLKVSSLTYNSAKLSWTKSESATGYEIYRSTKKDSGYKMIKSGLTSTSFTDKSLKTGTTYYYKVKAIRTDGSRTAESDFSKYVSAKPYLFKPSVKLSSGSKKITVKWSKVSDASGYKVYRSVKKSSGYKCIATVKKGSTKTYTNKRLKKGKCYYYKVRAYIKVSGGTVYSSYSSACSAKVK